MFSRARNPYIQIEDFSFDPATPSNPDYNIPLDDFSSKPLLKRHGYTRSDTSSIHGFQDSLETPLSQLSKRASSDTLKALPRIPKRFSWSGWRATVTADLAVTVGVFLSNITILGWAIPKLEPTGGNALLYKGDCNEMKSIDTWSHLGINILSTLLLGASNAAMQCLVAPSREDIDKAHPRGRVLEIGVNGLANWQNMGWRRRTIWFALLLSSLPFHLFYNSIIFSSTSASDYNAFITSEDFVHGAAFNVSKFGGSFSSEDETEAEASNALSAVLTAIQKNTTVLPVKNLTNSDCISTFGQTFVSNFLNVVVVTEGGNSNDTVINIQGHSSTSRFSDLTWICDQHSNRVCDVTQTNASNWILDATVSPPLKAKYCLAQPTQPSCTVELFPALLYTVIACNVIKAICFTCLIFLRFNPIITIGDAIASFLENPDPTTAGLGAMSARDVRGKWRVAGNGAEYFEELNKDRVWRNKRCRWFSGASPLRWIGAISTCTGYWIIGISLLMAGQSGTTASFHDQWVAGLGSIVPSDLLSTSHVTQASEAALVIQNVLIANAPQVVLSLVYIQYNGLFTCMLLSREWAAYASSRKGLRTTIPQGAQRSSYWLSLPYKFSLPLLVASGLLHWLLSQSLFLAQVNVVAANGSFSNNSVSTVGWGSLSLTLLLALGGTMILTIVGFGFMRYAPGIPIASSCSRAISAACHPPPGRYSENVQRVQYGVVMEEDGKGEGKGHVGFSARDGGPLVDGHVYT